jgi:hypothetical protein
MVDRNVHPRVYAINILVTYVDYRRVRSFTQTEAIDEPLHPI